MPSVASIFKLGAPDQQASAARVILSRCLLLGLMNLRNDEGCMKESVHCESFKFQVVGGVHMHSRCIYLGQVVQGLLRTRLFPSWILTASFMPSQQRARIFAPLWNTVHRSCRSEAIAEAEAQLAQELPKKPLKSLKSNCLENQQQLLGTPHNRWESIQNYVKTLCPTWRGFAL